MKPGWVFSGSRVGRALRAGLAALALAGALAAPIGAIPSAVAAPGASTIEPLDFLDIPISFQGHLDIHYGNASYSGPFLHMAGRGRFDYQVNQQPQALILRHDMDQAMVLWPAQQWYVSAGLSQVAAMAGGLDQAKLTRTPEGIDRVNDEPCTRWKASSTVFHGNIWTSTDGILIKAEGTVTVRGREIPASYSLSHVERHPVDPGQFEAPQNWLGLPLAGLLKGGPLPNF